MRLVTPTDFDILAAMADGRRNNAINLAALLDRNQITPKGRVVAEHRDAYADDEVNFDALVEKALEEEQNSERTLFSDQ